MTPINSARQYLKVTTRADRDALHAELLAADWIKIGPGDIADMRARGVYTEHELMTWNTKVLRCDPNEPETYGLELWAKRKIIPTPPATPEAYPQT